jgi:cobalt-zinc-cadmium efflux system outer membrane protein
MSTLLGVRRRAAACGAALCILLAGSTPVRATLQEGKAEPARSPSELEAPPYSVPSPAAVPTGAVSSIDLVRRAMSANAGLAAARLDVDRARARLRQAGLRPNPSLDLERRTGRFTGSSGEGEASVGVAVPLELFGQRARRVDLAEVELDAAEAEIAERERQLASEVRGRFAEALAASRDLRVTSPRASRRPSSSSC